MFAIEGSRRGHEPHPVTPRQIAAPDAVEKLAKFSYIYNEVPPIKPPESGLFFALYCETLDGPAKTGQPSLA